MLEGIFPHEISYNILVNLSISNIEHGHLGFVHLGSEFEFFILLYDMLTTKQLPGVIQIIYIKFNDHHNYTNLRSLKISMSN